MNARNPLRSTTRRCALAWPRLVLATVIPVLLALFVSSCGSKPAGDRAEQAIVDARRLTEKKDYAGALEKHVWFHDHALEVNPAYYGVRLSFALAHWVELGKQYPPALEKLRQIRDAKTARLTGGEMNRDLFHDVASINDHLEDPAGTAQLFKKLDATTPEFAAELGDLAAEALIDSREYALARKYLGDPDQQLADAKARFEEGLDYARSSGNQDMARRAFETIFTDKVIQLIEVLNHTGDEDGAKRIQTAALQVLDNQQIRDALKR